MPEETREELLEYLKTCSPRTRNTFVQMIEGKVSEKDSTTVIRERLSFMEPDLTPRELTFVSSRLCDCGALIVEKNRLVATSDQPVGGSAPSHTPQNKAINRPKKRRLALFCGIIAGPVPPSGLVSVSLRLNSDTRPDCHPLFHAFPSSIRTEKAVKILVFYSQRFALQIKSCGLRSWIVRLLADSPLP